jgi:hypothetical protein
MFYIVLGENLNLLAGDVLYYRCAAVNKDLIFTVDAGILTVFDFNLKLVKELEGSFPKVFGMFANDQNHLYTQTSRDGKIFMIVYEMDNEFNLREEYRCTSKRLGEMICQYTGVFFSEDGSLSAHWDHAEEKLIVVDLKRETYKFVNFNFDDDSSPVFNWKAQSEMCFGLVSIEHGYIAQFDRNSIRL